MAVEIKTHDAHPKSMAERANRRLRASNDSLSADQQYQNGTGSNRTITTLHHSGLNSQHKRSEKGRNCR